MGAGCRDLAGRPRRAPARRPRGWALPRAGKLLQPLLLLPSLPGCCCALEERASPGAVRARGGCRGTAKQLLCAGGLLRVPAPAPPAQRTPPRTPHSAAPGGGGGPCPDVRREVRRRYDAALGDGTSDIRTHIPTLLEYARRVRSVAEMGVHRGYSSLAFARAALEAPRREGESLYRYRMYDIARTGGVEAVSSLLGSCPGGVDFAFREGDVLDQEMVNGSRMEAPELLFVDTAHTYEQLAKELDAFGPLAGRYIVLHDTETFGDSDEGVHDEGTLRSYKRRRQRLLDEQRRQVLALSSESGGAITEEALAGALASAEAAVRGRERTGLRTAVLDWLAGPVAGGAWMVLEHSAADNGLTVLGRRSALAGRGDMAPPAALESNATGRCDRRGAARALAQARRRARRLLDYSVNYPGMFAGALSVNRKAAREVRLRLLECLRLCPSDLAAQAALRILLRHFSRDRPARRKAEAGVGAPAPALGLYSRAVLHPDLFFLAVSELSGPPAVNHYEQAVQRWPDRVEGWLGLAESLAACDASAAGVDLAAYRERLAHAWRRVLALRAGNRRLANLALIGLQELGLGEEAAAAWDELAPGAERLAQTAEGRALALTGGALWDDPRRHPGRTWRPALTGSRTPAFPRAEDLAGHPEFKLATAIIKARWEELRAELLEVVRTRSASEVNGFCKGTGWCEYMLLSYEGCNFYAECMLAPALCNALRDMEAGGLRVARAAVSAVGTWETTQPDVHIAPHGSSWPGRLRLSCTLLVSEGTTSTMYIAGEAPRVYEEGACFWFDESLTHEVVHESRGREPLRATLYLDAMHPAYYGDQAVEVGHHPGSLGAWQGVLAGGGGDVPLDGASGQSVPGLGLLLQHEAKPYAYSAKAADTRHWVKLAVTLQREHSNTCILGDNGALFHEVAFRRKSHFWSVAILLGIFRRAEGFIQNAPVIEPLVRGGVEAILARLRTVTANDIEQLRDQTWGCIAMGCKYCRAMEVSGLCVEGLTEQMRKELLDSFSELLRMETFRIETWFRYLGFTVPPPLGWSMHPVAFRDFVVERFDEIKAMNIL